MITTTMLARHCRLPFHRRVPTGSRSFRSNPASTVITTDEGVRVHTSDPSTTGDGLGLVWGSVLWPSGIALAKYASFVHQSHNNDIAAASRVLELGCGTGVVGLTWAKYSSSTATQLTLTDSESALWPLLRKSLQDNGLEDDRVQIHGLDWRDPTTFLTSNQPYDLVLAADVLYSGMDKLFARALASHLHVDTTIGLVASPFRKDSPLLGFLQAAHRLGLRVQRLEDGRGRAVGAYSGTDPQQAYRDSVFVPVAGEDRLEEVSKVPTFGQLNEKQIQIFRVERIRGTPEESASIRRIGRI